MPNAPRFPPPNAIKPEPPSAPPLGPRDQLVEAVRELASASKTLQLECDSCNGQTAIKNAEAKERNAIRQLFKLFGTKSPSKEELERMQYPY